MKKVYLQPNTQDVPLHAGELMIPVVGTGSGGKVTGGPTNPGVSSGGSAPARLSTMYI